VQTIASFDEMSHDPLRVDDVVSLRNLAPGAYTLRATITDGSRTAIRDLGFAVR
jgi:hypothetical protein